MVNVLVPSMGGNFFFENTYFPKPLMEIFGKTMLETVRNNFYSLSEYQMIYVFNQSECNQFHLDASIKILDEKSAVLLLREETAGALCTSLMAVEFIGNNMPLLIVNSDQIIDVDYSKVLDFFESYHADGGVISFPSVHPRWSYVNMEGDDVVEVAEKHPLSRRAIAGFYYFKYGIDYIKAAKSAILKQNCINGKYYISASLNEMILAGKRIKCFEIAKEQYHSFYSPEKIKEYEKNCGSI